MWSTTRRVEVTTASGVDGSEKPVIIGGSLRRWPFGAGLKGQPPLNEVLTARKKPL